MIPGQKNLYVVFGAVFVVYTGFAFALPFLPLYVRALGVTDEAAAARWAGVLIGVAPLLAGLLAPAWGRLGDRHGYKPVVLVALLAYALFVGLSALVRSPLELLLLRVGTGLFGGIGPLGLAMATSAVGRDDAGRGVGLVQSAQILSAAVGPLAGGLLSDAIGMRLTFVATSVLCLLAFLLVAALYSPPEPGVGGGPAACPPSLVHVLSRAGVVSLLGVLFFVNFVGRSFTPILPLHLLSLGVAPSRVGASTGALISVYSLAAALSASVCGLATKRFDVRSLLAWSLLGGTATVLPMARVPSFTWFLVLGILLGLASGGSLTLCYTLGDRLVGGTERATAFGFFSGAALFGGAVSPSIAGISAKFGLRTIYYLDAAILGLLAGGLLWTRLRSDAVDTVERVSKGTSG